MANDAIKNIITAAVTAGLSTAAANANNDLTHKDVAAVTTTVTAAVNKEVQPVITNVTNQEPWYQSRVIIGTTVAMLCTFAKLAGHEIPMVEQSSVVDLVLLGGQLVGGAFALYGRIFGASLKPIGA